MASMDAEMRQSEKQYVIKYTQYSAQTAGFNE
jgi:hypothetical protein